ncbi:hypothetical protein U9M48_027850 [Paspalum notatum var. saurae]
MDVDQLSTTGAPSPSSTPYPLSYAQQPSSFLSPMQGKQAATLSWRRPLSLPLSSLSPGAAQQQAMALPLHLLFPPPPVKGATSPCLLCASSSSRWRHLPASSPPWRPLSASPWRHEAVVRSPAANPHNGAAPGLYPVGLLFSSMAPPPPAAMAPPCSSSNDTRPPARHLLDGFPQWDSTTTSMAAAPPRLQWPGHRRHQVFDKFLQPRAAGQQHEPNGEALVPSSILHFCESRA